MVFSSILFLFIYLPVVLAVYYIVPVKWRNVWLFIVNMVFYGWGEPVYILLMLLCIGVNYGSGLLIEKFRADDKKARLILALSSAVSLRFLLFFKYYNLITATRSMLPRNFHPPAGRYASDRHLLLYPFKPCHTRLTCIAAMPMYRRISSASAPLWHCFRSLSRDRFCAIKMWQTS